MKLHGRSEAHCELLEKLAAIATSDATVLITGPSGVGKELYARYVHDESRRANRPFVAVNCGIFTDELLESTFFGHVRGAFTGAYTGHKGLVVAAQGGTLFLDEVDTLRPANQVKLLRFLQEKEFRPLGDTCVRKADVRIVAASNINLEQAVHAGQFREDLFFRLRVAPFAVPPLSERPEDVDLLLGVYVDHFATKHALPLVELGRSARESLMSHDWPGNVRELVNCVEYLTLLKLDRRVEHGDLNLVNWHDTDKRPVDHKIVSFQAAKQKVVRDFERGYLTEALRKTGGNIRKAAELCEKDRRAFFELMRKNGIEAGAFKRSVNAIQGTSKQD